MYHVYSITTPDNKYRYYGTSKNLNQRLSLHKSRFYERTAGSDYYVYTKLRSLVKHFEDCKIKVLDAFEEKVDAFIFENNMIVKNGNLNSRDSITLMHYNAQYGMD